MPSELQDNANGRSASRAWAPWTALAVGLAFTAAATVQLNREIDEKERGRFTLEATDIARDIEKRLESFIVMLRAGSGFVGAVDEVNLGQFRNFVERLNIQTQYQGIQGVGLAWRVAREDKEQFEQAHAADGTNFHIHPDQGQPEFYSIVYLEPLDRRNLAAIGYDMYAEPMRRAAMQRATDTAAPAATELVTLVQEIDEQKQPGFLIYCPVYADGVPATVEERRQRVKGFVYSPFRAHDLISDILAEPLDESVRLQVFDGEQVASERLLFDSYSNRADLNGEPPRYVDARPIEIAGRRWTLHFETGPYFHSSIETALVRRVFLAGLLGSFAMFGLTWMQERSRKIADLQRLAALQESQRRREAEATVRREKHFTDIATDSLPGMFYVIRKDGTFLRWNRTFEQVTGYTHEQVAQSHASDYFRPEMHDILNASVAKAFEKGFASIEAPMLTADGREIPYLFTGARILFEGQECLVGMALDISERKRAEAELARHREHLEELVVSRTSELEETHQRLRLSERMAALGTLLAGLGHDMGNLLLPIRLRLDAMEARGLSQSLADDVQAVRKAAEYLQRLVNGLRMFATDPDQRANPNDLSTLTSLKEWWADVQPILHNSVPREVTLSHRFHESLPRLRMARHLITQVMFNLVQNAGEALRGREDGRVMIEINATPDQQAVVFTVSDNGPGMTPEVQQRCMEPFFTTKTRGLSTGLGLALVHTIVEQGGGSIQLRSSPGRGATFTVTLPAAPPDAEQNQDRLSISRNALVSVRDDRMQAYVASVLESNGFSVQPADEPLVDLPGLWVTDSASPAEIREFVSQRSENDQERRVLWFGKPTPELQGMNNVTVGGHDLKPAAIRQTLAALMNQMSELTVPR